PPRPTLFPYTTLFRSPLVEVHGAGGRVGDRRGLDGRHVHQAGVELAVEERACAEQADERDRRERGRHPERRAGGQPEAKRAVHASSSPVYSWCRMYPTPRTVWMSGGPWRRSFRRRLATWTSTTLLMGSKCRSHTFSRSSVRRTTSSGRSRKYSRSRYSFGVRSSSAPARM